MTYDYDFCVFVGRFQPAHSGHYVVIQEALKRAKRLVIVIGSHNSSRNTINPWTSKERIGIILAMVTPEEASRIDFTVVEDHAYKLNAWIAEVQDAIETATFKTWTSGPMKIALIGHQKDGTSFYLKMFPEFDFIDVASTNGLSATDLRAELFEGFDEWQWSKHIVNTDHAAAIGNLWENTDFTRLIEEWDFLEEYREEWGPKKIIYNADRSIKEIITLPVKALTTDAVVTCGGYILLIQRGKFPGKGYWALPGGFLNDYEYLLDGMIRELHEETKLKVPKPVLYGSVSGDMIADDPYRDQRGRIVSRAYHLDIKWYGKGNKPEDIELPEIKASDDAAHAEWVKLGSLKKLRPNMYADHYDIIENLVGSI